MDEVADQGLAAQLVAQGGARVSGYSGAEGLLLEQMAQLLVRDEASW